MILNNCTRCACPLALALTMAMSLSVASVFAQSPTFVRTDYPFLGNNHVAEDFNGDGKPDLASAGGMSAAIMLGNGDGTFQGRVEYPVASWSQDLAAGDFNLDGRLDLVVTINDPHISLSLLTGNGNGTFNAPVNFPNTSHLDSPAVVATDLDNDGALDVVIGHQIACWTAPCVVGRTITVMRGNGNGTFQAAKEVDIGVETAKIAVGHFDRDGIKDLGIASSRSRVTILLGRGDGTFNQQPTLTLIPENNLGMDNTDIDVADLNGDTLQDLVVAVSLNGSRTAILIGNGDGTFQHPPLLITEPNMSVPQYQAVADYNNDGFQDLALALGDGTFGLMEILDGNGNGTFRAPVMYLVPPPKSSIGGGVIIAGDFNADAKPDIALAIVGASPALAVLRNSTGVAPPPAPSAPTLVSPAQDAGPSQPVMFDWTDVSAARSYRIQIDDSNTFSAPLVVNQTVTVSQFTAGSLAPRRHWWRVRGINSVGTAGAWSTVRRFTPQNAPTAPTLSAIALSPSTVVGGNASQGTATLTSAAPTGGAVVPLTSSNTAVATVPASVTVASGTRSVSFTVTTPSVTASRAATISGSYGGATRSATLTVTPLAQTVTLTVTATGRSGERVTSSPAGINVAVGSSGSASFVGGTVITLSVSNGREGIWSGACSSAGNKSKTCAFTLTATAAVTANVQ